MAMDDTSQTSQSGAGSAPLTDYFQQLASVLKLDPDQYHDGSGNGQAQPNSMFGASTQTAPASPAPDNNVTAVPTAPVPGAALAVPPAQPSPGAAGPQGAVPTTTGGATPVTPYTPVELADAQKMSGPQTPLPNANLRMIGAALGGSQVFNQTINDIQSGDEAKQRMASNTIQMARNLNSLAQEGFQTQKLAIEAQNNQTLAQAANDPNSAFTTLTKATMLDSLGRPITTVDPKTGKQTSTTLMGPAALAQYTAFINNPKTTAFQLLQNPVLQNLPSIQGLNAQNVDVAIKLQTVANAHLQAQAAQTNAGAEVTKANTGVRNQNMMENATGISGDASGTPVVAPSNVGTPSPVTTKPTVKSPSAAGSATGKYVLDRNGVELSPATETMQKADAEEFNNARNNQPEIQTTQQAIDTALQTAEGLRKNGFTGPIANAVSKYGADPRYANFASQLNAVQTNYAKAFANEAGARAGGNVMIETKEANTVGDPSQNIDVVINSLKRLGKSIETRNSYNQQVMGAYTKDRSLDNFKFTPPYNTQGWALHKDSKGNQAYVDPTNPKNFQELQ